MNLGIAMDLNSLLLCRWEFWLKSAEVMKWQQISTCSLEMNKQIKSDYDRLRQPTLLQTNDHLASRSKRHWWRPGPITGTYWNYWSQTLQFRPFRPFRLSNIFKHLQDVWGYNVDFGQINLKVLRCNFVRMAIRDSSDGWVDVDSKLQGNTACSIHKDLRDQSVFLKIIRIPIASMCELRANRIV